jgi:hypothetical protein
VTITVVAPRRARCIPPPLPRDGGGFWYVRRSSGAILLDDEGDYVRFDTDVEANAYARSVGARAVWMPKMQTH